MLMRITHSAIPSSGRTVSERVADAYRSLAALLLGTLILFVQTVSSSLAMAQPADPVSVSATVASQSVRPGAKSAIAITLNHDEPWHTQAHDTTVAGAVGTSIRVKQTAGVTAGPVRWPEAVPFTADLGNGPTEILVYEGEATAIIPLWIAPDAAGEISIQVDVGYQTCDDSTCLAPTTKKLTVKINVDPAAPETTWSGLFSGMDEAVFKKFGPHVGGGELPPPGPVGSGVPVAAGDRPIPFNVFGWKFSIDPTGLGFVVLLLVAVVGGLVLNATPCVLPVIPLKIMGLQQAAGSPGRTLLLGTVMCVGVVSFWLVLGGTVAFSTSFKGASQLFGYWWFTFGVGVFILVMGLGSFGAFSVGLPQWVYSINPRQDTLPGAFLFGIMTAVLGTPCVGPFMGTAVSWATTQSAAITLITFGAVGVGMALPYFVLALKPSWVHKMPRSGPIGELVKQVLGLLMVAVSMFFIGSGLVTLTNTHPYLGSVLHWWALAIIAACAMVWMLLRGFAITKGAVARVALVIVAMLICAGSFWWANGQTDISRRITPVKSADGAHAGPWQSFTKERYEAAKAAGKVTVVDFTAVWCINCKALDAIMHSPDVIREIEALGVVALTGDVTNTTETPGWEMLTSLEGRAGPPWAIIEGPGLPGGWRSEAYTAGDVIQTLRKAAGKTPPVADASDRTGRTSSAE